MGDMAVRVEETWPQVSDSEQTLAKRTLKRHGREPQRTCAEGNSTASQLRPIQ
jgi:hypothetical protein